MRHYGTNFRRTAPFIRLLAALVAGILLQRSLELPATVILAAMVIALPGWVFLRFAAVHHRFRWRWVGGLSICLVLMAAGAALLYTKDIRHRSSWMGHRVAANSLLLVTINEPLAEKTGSFKTIAVAEAIYLKGKWMPVSGNILLYFKKENIPAMGYGTQLVIHKSPQPVSSSGNPGAFDYAKYCAGQNIYHQLYLQRSDYALLPTVKKDRFHAVLLSLRDQVLATLQQYIPGEKEAGVAEALLIGYRNHLDKDLVQAYSNTGVVHIIAISGLHLGMIYGLLIAFLKLFRGLKWTRFAKPVIILAVLWGFTLLTGAAASILRSAVMFSFIVIGESIGRKSSIYNTLAASAFCLLVYDPNMLWDVGFQLSYAAVLSIVIFMKPIYRQVYCENKLLSMIWELNSITLAAQILTLPLILFYFHQFPNLFLFTNFIAVPLSGFILYGELLLLLLSQLPVINTLAGRCVSFMISQMNGVIERTDRLPFGVTGDISFTLLQTMALYAALASLGYWVFYKQSRALVLACAVLVGLAGINCLTSIGQQRQQLLIVYNVPRQSAMDIMEGKRYRFFGDPGLQQDRFLRNFHLQPARIIHGVEARPLLYTQVDEQLLRTRHKTVLLVNPFFRRGPALKRVKADLVILSHSPRISLAQLAAVVDCPQYVFDSSNPLWKIREWKKQADSLHLRHHSVPEQGAFQMAF
jgi:competence protein ComEC